MVPTYERYRQIFGGENSAGNVEGKLNQGAKVTGGKFFRRPIYPTQEVINVSSGSEDEQHPLIPRTEEDHVSSPSSKIIIEVLTSMNKKPQQHSPPSFDLGIEPPFITTQDLSDIEELDELIRDREDQFQTPKTTKSLETQKDLEDKVVISIMCHILNKEKNERFEKFVYCVPPEILVNPVRMFEKHGHNWMDNEKRPHDISTLLFAPILCSEHWWLYVLDVEKKDFFILDSKNIVSPSDERLTMN
ncbi:hypothetical protein PIB30_060875 [Stylosanthes scabra]|uniref:Ubiquitin-like protease family profile domain-containing protein n=1 Tax=Stylosanthes scabra TaxID=79078 RepID=A0ABU6ZJD2_9FABA|nr:hypothetical protein [Stylosanthes scabra]